MVSNPSNLSRNEIVAILSTGTLRSIAHSVAFKWEKTLDPGGRRVEGSKGGERVDRRVVYKRGNDI